MKTNVADKLATSTEKAFKYPGGQFRDRIGINVRWSTRKSWKELTGPGSARRGQRDP